MATGSVVEMQKNEKREGVRLEITRVIKAKRERVFDAFTRPEVIRQWFGSGDRLAKGAEADARVGGEYSIAIGAEACANSDLPAATVKGRYVKVDPYDLLQFTWSAAWSPDEESLVTIALKDVEGGTEMHLVHEGFVTEVSCTNHEMGWKGGLDNLVKLLESA